jgi:hypothetical protein
VFSALKIKNVVRGVLGSNHLMLLVPIAAEDAVDLALVDAEHRAKLFLREFSPLVESLDLRSPLDAAIAQSVSKRV